MRVNDTTEFTDLKGKLIPHKLLEGRIRMKINPMIWLQSLLVFHPSITNTRILTSAVVHQIEEEGTSDLQKTAREAYNKKNPEAAGQLSEMLQALKLEGEKKDGPSFPVSHGESPYSSGYPPLRSPVSSYAGSFSSAIYQSYFDPTQSTSSLGDSTGFLGSRLEMPEKTKE